MNSCPWCDGEAEIGERGICEGCVTEIGRVLDGWSEAELVKESIVMRLSSFSACWPLYHIPDEGERYGVAMKSGRWRVFEVFEVERCRDPKDMAFIKVRLWGDGGAIQPGDDTGKWRPMQEVPGSPASRCANPTAPAAMAAIALDGK